MTVNRPYRSEQISSPLGTTQGITRYSEQPGPHFAVFAGVHGDEIASRIAAAVLAQAAIPKRGRFTVFMNANPASCLSFLRYAPDWSGGEDEDLNRAFGHGRRDPHHRAQLLRCAMLPEVAHAEAISAWLQTEMPDFVLDLHEGLIYGSEGLTPAWYYAETEREEAYIPHELAGFEPCSITMEQPNSLSGECGRLGIPSLTQETRQDAPLYSRIILHVLGAGSVAELAGSRLDISGSQVDFLLRQYRDHDPGTRATYTQL